MEAVLLLLMLVFKLLSTSEICCRYWVEVKVAPIKSPAPEMPLKLKEWFKLFAAILMKLSISAPVKLTFEFNIRLRLIEIEWRTLRVTWLVVVNSRPSKRNESCWRRAVITLLSWPRTCNNLNVKKIFWRRSRSPLRPPVAELEFIPWTTAFNETVIPFKVPTNWFAFTEMVDDCTLFNKILSWT